MIPFRSRHFAFVVLAGASLAGAALSSGGAQAQYYYPNGYGAYPPGYRAYPGTQQSYGAPRYSEPDDDIDYQPRARPRRPGQPVDVSPSRRAVAALPPDADPNYSTATGSDADADLNQTTRATVVDPTGQSSGTLTINTARRKLYLSLGDGRALEYGIGVGRQGFAWKGDAQVGRKAYWPGWTPPKEMIARRPDLPDHMDGGLENPLGARALYLFKGNKDTLFRIHGTNEPDTIGKAVLIGLHPHAECRRHRPVRPRAEGRPCRGAVSDVLSAP